MRKKVYQNLGYLEDMHYAYQADYFYQKDDAINVFLNNVKKRKDLDEDFKQKLLNSSVRSGYEIVYYPAHIYQTDTTKSWNTTSTSTSNSSYEGFDIKTTTTTTTRHTRAGYKKVSEAKFKSGCDKLDIEKLNLDKTTRISKNNTIQMYKKDLFFDRKENGNNAVDAGRKASNAKKGDSTYTTWTLHIVFIPIFRYDFEYKGKTYYFEMNLHNGEYITHYKQKGGCAFARISLRIVHILLSLAMFLLPLIALIAGFKAGFIVGAGIIKKLLGVVIPGACVIGGFIMSFYYISTAKEEFEKLFYEPGNQIAELFIAPIITLAIILTLTLVFKGMAFN